LSLTFNAKTYAPDSYGSNAVGYIGATKTVSIKDDFVLRRTAPSPVSNFSGVAKASAKMTRTLTLTNALTPSGDGIVEIKFSIPVGAASADVDALLNDTGAYLSSASAKLLAKNQQVSY